MIDIEDAALLVHEDPPALREAIKQWRRGDPIPADLWFTLAGQGYDVAALEAQHLIT